jgi:flagellar hook-associated protein 1 FlgK
MTLFGVLNVGATGMSAAQLGTNVHSHSAANVATPGYTRRHTLLSPIAPPPKGGGGVRGLGTQRTVDRFVEQRLLGARSAAAEAAARSGVLATLDTSVESLGGGIGDALDALGAAAADLAAYPAERAARRAFLDAAEQVGRRFADAAAAIGQARSDANARIRARIDEVNDMMSQVAALNQAIARAEVGGGEASDLRDKRDELIRAIADNVPVKVIPQPDGAIVLLLAGGPALVSATGEVQRLVTVTEPVSGDVRVSMRQAGVLADVTGLVSSGAVGGLLAARDGALTRSRDALDQIAYDVCTAFNAAHSVGVGLDGIGARSLFDPIAVVAGAAGRLALSADVAGQPDRVAAALDPGSLPGDNRGALALQALSNAPYASGGRTAEAALGDLVGVAGTDVRRARNDEVFAAEARAQIEAVREAISGVNLDEEMIAIKRYQRAFQASLEVVRVADEMLGDLMRLRR